MSNRRELSRRHLLAGPSAGATHGEEHICSLVVHVRPERLADVTKALAAMAGVESHGASNAGKLVVTVEGTSDDHIVQTMGRISELSGVLSTALIFQHADGPGGLS